MNPHGSTLGHVAFWINIVSLLILSVLQIRIYIQAIIMLRRTVRSPSSQGLFKRTMLSFFALFYKDRLNLITVVVSILAIAGSLILQSFGNEILSVASAGFALAIVVVKFVAGGLASGIISYYTQKALEKRDKAPATSRVRHKE